ncbi:MAG: DMT family transporter [Candidatus Velthaea sp.]
MKRSNAAAVVAVIVLAMIWGYNWVVIKVATHDADAFSVSALRGIFGAVCLFAALMLTRRPLTSPPVGPVIVLGLLQTSIFSIFQTLAVASGGAGKTSVLVYTMPFWTALLAWPFLGERIKRNGWLALTLAALGLTLVLTPLDLAKGLAGKALAIAAALAWAAGTMYAKRLRARYPTELLSLTTWQMIYGTIPLAFVALAIPHHVNATRAFMASMIYIAVPGTAVAWLLWMFILSKLRAASAGIASLLTPVIGVIAAWIQLGERPGTLELVGIACIIGALIVNGLPERKAAGSAMPATLS